MTEKDSLLNQIVEAVLYEGYILYPYRASSRKNQQRFTFGRVHPEAYHLDQKGAEPCALLTQCLVKHPAGTAFEMHINVRFLHPLRRQIAALEPNGEMRPVPELEIDGHLFQTWQEAVERDVKAVLDPAEKTAAVVDFEFPGFERARNAPRRRRNGSRRGGADVGKRVRARGNLAGITR